MSGYNDVDLYITLHATFNGAYLQSSLHDLIDVPPDPGPTRANAAILPVETTLGGTRIRINHNTYLQISTVGDVDLNRVDNHITVRPTGINRPTPLVFENRQQQWQEPWLRRMREHIDERERRVAAAVRQNNDMAPQFQIADVNFVPFGANQQHNFHHIGAYNPPVIEMRNMNINRRPNEHDRQGDDEEDVTERNDS